MYLLVVNPQGNHGFRRFLRDGHHTVKENQKRKYYDPTELRVSNGVTDEKRQAERETDGQRSRQNDQQRDRQTNGQRDRQTDGQRGRQADRPMDRENDGQRE